LKTKEPGLSAQLICARLKALRMSPPMALTRWPYRRRERLRLIY
jgi:hypothetical protein